MCEMIKKVFIGQLGAPDGGYQQTEYDFNGEHITRKIPFSIVLDHEAFDVIFIVGTDKSFNREALHYSHYVEEVKIPFGERVNEIQISSNTDTPESFWQAFELIASTVRNWSKKDDELEIHADITYGLRNQSLLTFLVLLYLSTTHNRIRVGKIYYNSFNPPKIIDISETFQLIQWINALHDFEQFRSLERLISLLKPLIDPSNKVETEFILRLQNLHYSYAFNYVKDIAQHSRWTYEQCQKKEIRQLVQRSKPFQLAYWKFDEFFRIFVGINKNVEVTHILIRHFIGTGDYSKVLILLREQFLNIFQELLLLKENRQHRWVAEELINKVGYMVVPEKYKDFIFTEQDKKLALPICDAIRGTIRDDMVQFFTDWVEIRDMRNRSAHLKQINKEELIENFEPIIQQIKDIFKRAEKIYHAWIQQLQTDENYRKTMEELLAPVMNKNAGKDRRVFLIVNDALHSIVPLLKAQYGENIQTEIITRGNVGLDEEKEIARKTIEIVEKYPGHEFYIVPSGYQYLGVTVYNVVQQKTSVHPIWLHYDRDNQRYIEKSLDPRKLIFD